MRPSDLIRGMVEGAGGACRFLQNATRSSRPLLRAILTSSICAALAIFACGGQAGAVEARYVCSGGARVVADFSPPSAANGHVTLTFETGRKITLPQALSADGGRCADNDIEFWIKGQNATLTRGGVRQSCSTR